MTPLTQSEVRQFLLSCLPLGSDQVYDLSASANIGRIWTALAGAWKAYGTDYVDILRGEISPLTISQKIPDWESALGLANTPVARFGTTTQRRNAVISWLRQSGSFNLEDIRAICQPYFLYDNPADIVIKEPDRPAQKTLHTYAATVPWVVPPGVTQDRLITVLDDPKVSPAGVALNVLWVTTKEIGTTIALRAPDGNLFKTWTYLDFNTGTVNETVVLHAPLPRSYVPIEGVWTVTVTAGTIAVTINALSLFVEGLGSYPYKDADGSDRIGQGLGAAMFEYVVIADEALLGTGYDVDGARVALRRMKPAHVKCEVAWASVVAGHHDCAIPDTRSAIPDRAIPCS